MATITLKAEDGLLVADGLVELELSELEGLDLHRIANQLASGFYLDDGVITGHVVKRRQVVRLDLDVINDILGHFLCV